jgi:competence transcription factor ComK
MLGDLHGHTRTEAYLVRVCFRNMLSWKSIRIVSERGESCFVFFIIRLAILFFMLGVDRTCKFFTVSEAIL